MDLKSLITWIRFLRREAPFATVVGTPKAGLLGVISAWILRVPRRIYIVHGLRLEGASGPLRSVLWCIERVSCWLATDVVVVSHSLGKQMLRRRLVKSAKCWLIGQGSCNGVDIGRIQERVAEVDVVELRRSLGIPLGVPVIGFVGRITRDKGVGLLLETIEQIALGEETHLLIVGELDGDPGFDPNDLMKPKVTWVDGSDDVPALLSVMDVLVLPTAREGFPTVPLEAAAARVPTVTTNATGAVDSVVDGVTGLIVRRDNKVDLLCAVSGLLRDKEQRQKMGEAAFLRAESEFQPERIWFGLESIVNGSPSPDCSRLYDSSDSR